MSYTPSPELAMNLAVPGSGQRFETVVFNQNLTKVDNRAASDRGRLEALEAAIAVPAGNVEMTARSSAPTGWLLCDGAAVSRTTYAALFTAIGTQFGTGDGSTTFNVPNLKGRVVVGLDAGQTEFDVRGETGGAKTHTLSLSETPSHYHQLGPSSALDGTPDVYMVQETSGSTFPGWAFTVAGTSGGTRAVITDPQGGGGAHNNLQPYMALSYIIKT